MKLTKLERYTAYCIMLAEAENNMREVKNMGLCFLSKTLFGLGEKSNEWENNIKDYFPELEKRNPNNWLSAYWFPKNAGGWNRRKQLLKECIKETHP